MVSSICSMRSLLTRWLLLVAARATEWLVCIRKRVRWSIPLVALLLDLPGFRSATFEAHITARIRWTAKANLIPGVRMRIIGIDHILHNEQPEAMHRHLLPDIVGGWRLGIVNGLQYGI